VCNVSTLKFRVFMFSFHLSKVLCVWDKKVHAKF
jgi:hypothetical protein